MRALPAGRIAPWVLLIGLSAIAGGCRDAGISEGEIEGIARRAAERLERRALLEEGAPALAGPALRERRAALLAAGDAGAIRRLVQEALDAAALEGVDAILEAPRPRRGQPAPGFTLTWIDPATAHLRVPTLDARGYDARGVERLFQAARPARMLILDLRGAGGGAADTVEHLAGQALLAGTPLGVALSPESYRVLRSGIPLEALDRRDRELFARSGRVNETPFPGAAALLIDGATGGGGEALAAAFQHALRGPVLGAPSRGAGALTETFSLAGGVALRYPVAAVLTPQGAVHWGEPLVPDIALEPVEAANPAVLAEIMRALGR